MRRPIRRENAVTSSLWLVVLILVVVLVAFR
jgi:hypothetical protein